MTADLRTRIAAVMHAHQAPGNACLCGWEYDPIIDDSHFDHQAEAVIRELGLRQEWGALDETDSGCIYDSADEVRTLPRETVKSRYVTEWEDDE